MSALDFDTEKFILEIQNRPAIWKYSDKILRYRDWKELAEAYGAQTDEETKQLAMRLQKKWRNIRDMFVKTHRGKMRKTQTGKRKTEYAFYENLLFLQDSECLNSTTTDTEDTPTVEDVSGYEVKIEADIANDPLSSNDSWLKPKRKKFEIGTSAECGIKKDDDDVQLFFLSLVKEFNKIPENLRIQAKIDILKVIRNAQFSES